MTDLPILAVNTPKVATAEEDISSSLRSDQRRFLAEMGHGRGNQRIAPRPTKSFGFIEAVGLAVAGADGAGSEAFAQHFCAAFQLPCLVKFVVGEHHTAFTEMVS